MRLLAGIGAVLLLVFTVVPAGEGQGVAPVIQSISLTQGPVGVGVIIKGINFLTYSSGSSSVTVNGTRATISSSYWSPTQVTISVAQGTTSGYVVVHTALGSSQPQAYAFTVTPYTCGSCSF
jgi:hypothetical protein